MALPLPADATVDSFADAIDLAKRRAKRHRVDQYVVRHCDGYWIVTCHMPYLGEWYHVGVNGLVIRRG